MTEADLDVVIRIEQACFERPWTRSHFQAELYAGHSIPVVAEIAGEIAGYICLSVLMDEAEILDVAVEPSSQRCGTGKALLAWACDEALIRGATTIRLEVRTTSLPAIALYERFGFVPTGLRRSYYGQGVDALLMEKNIVQEVF